MELETKRAGSLELQPVNQQALLDIMLEMGGVQALSTGNFTPQGEKAILASNRMLTYCLGWGVKSEPPPDAIATLEALGKPTNLPEIARANWLRYIALESAEMSELVARVMKLTFSTEG
jgi:hypothetical protein